MVMRSFGAVARIDSPHLPTGAGIVVYNRASGRTRRQVGKTKKLLHEKSLRIVEEVERISPRNVIGLVEGIENGEIDGPRPHLARAIKLARDRSAIVVAYTVNRFLRASGDHRAAPSRSEFEALAAMANGVQLATVIPPNVDEAGQHAALIALSGKAGRPVAIDDDVAAELFEALEWAKMTGGCAPQLRFAVSLRKLVTWPRFANLSKSTILRVLERPSPNGRTWIQRLLEKGSQKFDDPRWPDSV